MNEDVLTSPPDPTSDAPPARSLLRRAAVVLLLLAIVGATLFIFLTPTGRGLRDPDHLHQLGDQFKGFVHEHVFEAIALYLVVYLICALLTLPVWWLQLLAGHLFGLVGGVALSLTGHVAGAVLTVLLSRWMGAGWVASHAGKGVGRVARLRQLVGDSGFLVVFAARVIHFVPYGLSNYTFGLTHIKRRHVALGTLAGGLPIVSSWVAVGSDPALVKDWRFWAVIVAINVAMLGPLSVRFIVRRRERERALREHLVQRKGAVPGR